MTNRPYFVRIHRYLVNLDNIAAVGPHTEEEIGVYLRNPLQWGHTTCGFLLLKAREEETTRLLTLIEHFLLNPLPPGGEGEEEKEEPIHL